MAMQLTPDMLNGLLGGLRSQAQGNGSNPGGYGNPNTAYNFAEQPDYGMVNINAQNASYAQLPTLGRYRPPMMPNGSPYEWTDSGGYSYNTPNSYGANPREQVPFNLQGMPHSYQNMGTGQVRSGGIGGRVGGAMDRSGNDLQRQLQQLMEYLNQQQGGRTDGLPPGTGERDPHTPFTTISPIEMQGAPFNLPTDQPGFNPMKGGKPGQGYAQAGPEPINDYSGNPGYTTKGPPGGNPGTKVTTPGLPTQSQQPVGFWRQWGRNIRDTGTGAWGDLQHGDPRGALRVGATLAGGPAAVAGGLLRAVPTDRLEEMGRNAWNGLTNTVGGWFQRSPRATPLGAYGPTAGRYSGLPNTGGQGGGGTPNWNGTDWGQYIAPDPNMGPPQYSAPTRDPSVRGRMGPSAVDILTAIGGLGGRAGIQGFLARDAAMSGMNLNPAGIKLSGISFNEHPMVR